MATKKKLPPKKKKIEIPKHFKMMGKLGYVITWEKVTDKNNVEGVFHKVGFTPSMESGLVTWTIAAAEIGGALEKHQVRVEWLKDKNNRKLPEYAKVQAAVKMFEPEVESLQNAHTLMNKLAAQMSEECLRNALYTADQERLKKLDEENKKPTKSKKK